METLSQIRSNLQEIQALADEAFARVAAEHPDAVACHTGCDDCCKALFDLSPVEAFFLGRAFLDLPRAERRDIERRAAKAAKEFDAVMGRAILAEGDQRMDIMSKARVDCPLLVEGRCALYRHRPITCRLYGVPVVISGKSRTCFKARFQKGRKYPTVDMGLLHQRLMQLSQVLAQRVPGLPTSRADVARALQTAAGGADALKKLLP